MSVGCWRGSCWKASPMFGDAFKAAHTTGSFAAQVQFKTMARAFPMPAAHCKAPPEIGKPQHTTGTYPKHPQPPPNEENSSINYWWDGCWDVFLQLLRSDWHSDIVKCCPTEPWHPPLNPETTRWYGLGFGCSSTRGHGIGICQSWVAGGNFFSKSHRINLFVFFPGDGKR